MGQNQKTAEAILDFARRFEKACKARLGVSLSAYRLLAVISKSKPNTVEPGAIADSMGFHRPSVTGLLDTLEKKGYVERYFHPSDRRRIVLSATKKGRNAANQMQRTYKKLLDSATSQMPAELAEYIADILPKIVIE